MRRGRARWPDRRRDAPDWPLFLWAHDAPQPDGWPERRIARQPPDRVICNSRYTDGRDRPLDAGVPRAVVHPPVLSGPAGLGARAAASCARQLGASDAGTTVILLASRLEEWKGHRVLLEAVEPPAR